MLVTIPRSCLSLLCFPGSNLYIIVVIMVNVGAHTIQLHVVLAIPVDLIRIAVALKLMMIVQIDQARILVADIITTMVIGLLLAVVRAHLSIIINFRHH